MSGRLLAAARRVVAEGLFGHEVTRGREGPRPAIRARLQLRGEPGTVVVMDLHVEAACLAREGLADPTDFIHDCEGYSDAEIQLVMRDNAMGLLQPAVI